MTVLGFDYGARRIGVASGSMRVARPIGFIDASNWKERVQSLIEEHQPDCLVVGLPRNLEGDDTDQTAVVRRFIVELEAYGLPVVPMDEAATSQLAEDRLRAGKKPYSKGDIDAEAAAIILQDYLDNVWPNAA